MKEPRLRPRADVLERQRRPVKELQRPDVVRDLDERNREIERVAHQRAHVNGRDLVAKEVRADDGADFDDVAVGRTDGVELPG